MSQNLVIPNKDNKVTFVFGGVVLATATNIIMNFGGEVYSTTGTSPKLVVIPADGEVVESLECDLSETEEVGKIFATITYFGNTSVNGSDITSRELNNSGQIIVAIGSQLIIEDGTVVANANSWVTDEEYKAFAKLKGFSIPATQPDREANLANAYDYINFSYEQQLQGGRVTPQTQTGCMPRNYVYAYNVLVSSTSIPQDFKNAQMLTAFAINDGVDTNAVKDTADLAGFNVGRGAYSETYQAGSNAPTLAQMPAVSRVLKPYTNMGLSGGGVFRENMGYLG